VLTLVPGSRGPWEKERFAERSPRERTVRATLATSESQLASFAWRSRFPLSISGVSGERLPSLKRSGLAIAGLILVGTLIGLAIVILCKVIANLVGGALGAPPGT
jgi:hypothetical protein